MRSMVGCAIGGREFEGPEDVRGVRRGDGGSYLLISSSSPSLDGL